MPTVTASSLTYSSVTGQSITLGCSVSANPDVNLVFWQVLSNGQYVSLSLSGGKYTGSTVNSPSLTILNSQSGDTATYRCGATNTVGTGYSSGISLQVTGSKYITVCHSFDVSCDVSCGMSCDMSYGACVM